MENSTRKQVTKTLSKLSRIKEVQTIEAKVQDHGDYSPLNEAFGINENSERIVDKGLQALIHKTTKNVNTKKIQTSGFSITGFGLIAFAAISIRPALTPPHKLSFTIAIVSVLLACPAFYLSSKARLKSVSVTQKEILEKSDNSDQMSRDLETLKTLSDLKITVYGKDIDGQFWKYSPQILNIENWRLFLLGGIGARSVLFFEGPFPTEGLYILKSDLLKLNPPTSIEKEVVSEDEIQPPKNNKLEPTEEEANFPIDGPNNQTQKKTDLNLKPIIDPEPNRLQFLLNEQALSTHLETILLKLEGLDYLPTKVKITKPRKKYAEFIQLINKDWGIWKKLQGNPKLTNEDAIALRDKIDKIFYPRTLHPKGNKSETSDITINVIKMAYRPFNEWLANIENFSAQDTNDLEEIRFQSLD